MTLKGIVHKYGKDNIDTDVILPGPYLKIHDHDELSKHAMEGIDTNFAKKVSKGDFILAGNNFGCGSSREHAPIALSHCGITAVLAHRLHEYFIEIVLTVDICYHWKLTRPPWSKFLTKIHYK